MVVMMNNSAAVTTILGPEGVSHCSDPKSPPKTTKMPTMAERNAICSGPVEKRRAIAAGKISIEVISKTPTIFIEIAITTAINNIRTILDFSGFIPSACAISTFTVDANKECQEIRSIKSTNAPPPQITAISLGVTAKISPKRKPIKSTLTHVIKLNPTNPSAKAECASSPSNASEERLTRLCNKISAREMKTDTENTANVVLTSKCSANATPSKAAQESVSPK